jgi:quinol monooxygenase YgiN
VAEVAKKFHLNVVAVESISDNKSMRSNETIKLPYKDDAIAVAFSIDEGTDSSFSEALDAKKNKVYWLLHVDSVTPRHVAAFEKFRDKALKKWKTNKQYETALELASDFIAQIKEGNDLEKLAGKNGRVHGVTPSFDRHGKLEDGKNKNFKNIIEKVHEDAFALEKSKANFKEIDGTVVVYQVKDIISPKEINQKDEAKYKNELRSEMIDDMYQQLVGYLSKKYEIKINYELLKKINEEVAPSSLEEIF